MNAKQLAQLHARAFSETRSWTAEEFDTLLNSPTTILESVPNAFVLGRLVGDEAEILTIATDPGSRRQGKAAEVLSRFENTVQASGGMVCFLEVGAQNIAARQLYAASGYEPVGIRKGYYRLESGQTQDALILEKRFDGA